VVLHADPGSRIYAGLKPGLGPEELRRALNQGGIADCLGTFYPQVGDCFYLPAGTVHALGGGLVLFEVQQNSDVTFRLHDWDRVDAKTGKPRQLHIEESLACTDFAAGPSGPVTPVVEESSPVRRERLINCSHFALNRWHGSQPFSIGGSDSCHILIGVQGQAQLVHDGVQHGLGPGDVVLLPAESRSCVCRPSGVLTLLECKILE
jgi:mannose-6-phosphate isomerase